jgi:hypothetical protein
VHESKKIHPLSGIKTTECPVCYMGMKLVDDAKRSSGFKWNCIFIYYILHNHCFLQVQEECMPWMEILRMKVQKWRGRDKETASQSSNLVHVAWSIIYLLVSQKNGIIQLSIA